MSDFRLAPHRSEIPAAGTVSNIAEAADSTPLVSRAEMRSLPAMPSPTRHPIRWAQWFAGAAFSLVCLLALLAVGAATPVLNLLVMGYLMQIQSRVAHTGKLRSAFHLLPAAQRLGGLFLAIWLLLWPIRILTDAAHDSWILAPNGATAWGWTALLTLASALILLHVLLAIARGGGWWHFFRPVNNAHVLLHRFESKGDWTAAYTAFHEFVTALQLPQLLRLGILGYVAAYLYLAVPAWLYTAPLDLTSSWRILVFLVGGMVLAFALTWLPWLHVHVAAAGRWGAMLELATVRRLAAASPLLWMLSTAALYAVSILPLLYEALFKLRLPPHAARWDLMLVFLVTVVPARLLIGWVYHRARRSQLRASWPAHVWRAGNAVLLLAGVASYVYFLGLARTEGELGRRAIWQFHAVLLPLPF